MSNTKEQSAGVDQAAELEEWYAELGRIWDEQKTVGEGTERWKQLCRDEEELAVVIAELETGIQQRAAAVNTANGVADRQADATVELRVAAADVLTPKPVVEHPSAHDERDQAERLRQRGCETLVDRLTEAAGRPDKLAAAFQSVHPDIVQYWSEHMVDWITFDGRGKLSEEWDRRIQLWLQALAEARRNLSQLRKIGAISDDELEATVRTYAKVAARLQNILLLHPAAGEHEGKPLGMRNKPGRMTDGGNLQTLRPISGDALKAAGWQRQYSEAS